MKEKTIKIIKFFPDSKVYKEKDMFSSDFIVEHNKLENCFQIEIDEICLGVKSIGKKICILIDEHLFISSLNINGRWTIKKPTSVHIQIIFDDSSIYFTDSDSRANFSFVEENSENFNHIFKNVGPDLMSDDFELDFFIERIKLKKYKNRKLHELLLDQECFSGIGNYIRADVIYDSKLQYDKTIISLTNEELKRLFISIRKIMFESYRNNGFTFSSYYDVEGNAGKYKTKVYGKKITEEDEIINTVMDKNKRLMYFVVFA